jgi:hypothetical protein
MLQPADAVMQNAVISATLPIFDVHSGGFE